MGTWCGVGLGDAGVGGVAATDEALSDLKGVGEPAGKRERGEELAHLPVRHPLWGQGSLEVCNGPGCCWATWVARLRH